MRIKIARDARPQARILLLAALITVALWFIPYTAFLTYPFRLFVTFIHEGGHAIAALLTGNTVRSLSVSIDTSGLTETYTAQGGTLAQMFISSAGYLGAMSFGALLLVLIRRTVAARLMLFGSGALVLALTVIYGLIVPLTYYSFSPFTIVAGVLIGLGLVAAARYASPRVANFLISFLAVQCVLNALFDLKTVLFLSVSSDAHTDAGNMYAATGVPAIIWALLWGGLAFVILSVALRAYAVSREKATTQPDLPFEEPLEV